MRTLLVASLSLFLTCAFSMAQRFSSSNLTDNVILKGAWQLKADSAEQVLIFQDGYWTHTDYNKAYREFNYSRGGTVSLQSDSLVMTTEFHSKDRQKVGQHSLARISFSNGELTIDWGGTTQVWTRIDKGGTQLSGCWRINGRWQDNRRAPFQAGDRKTIKILSGTRFQWVAINTATKEFFGTGGGTYTFDNGKYTEHIDFFPRDSSRVGSTLVFDGKLENDVWLHSGLSSKGDPIKETWIRHK